MHECLLYVLISDDLDDGRVLVHACDATTGAELRSV